MFSIVWVLKDERMTTPHFYSVGWSLRHRTPILIAKEHPVFRERQPIAIVRARGALPRPVEIGL